MTKILLTTTSYQDIPGPHHDLLASTGAEIVRARGPLSEQQMLDLAGDFDAFLCGDDEITKAVIEKSLPRLKYIAKYGIGVDKIDVEECTAKGIPLSFCPGVNHTTVAEHTFVLMLSLFRNFVDQVNVVRTGEWKRMTGNEIMGKTIGIIGLGRIGKEVATRAKAFGLNVVGYDLYWPEEFAATHEIKKAQSMQEIFTTCDIISLHTNLTDETRDMGIGTSRRAGYRCAGSGTTTGRPSVVVCSQLCGHTSHWLAYVRVRRTTGRHGDREFGADAQGRKTVGPSQRRGHSSGAR